MVKVQKKSLAWPKEKKNLKCKEITSNTWNVHKPKGELCSYLHTQLTRNQNIFISFSQLVVSEGYTQKISQWSASPNQIWT